MNGRVIPGTRLAAYGHGDWNDSMQPFDPAMRERLCSAWTVTLHYQTLATLAAAFRRLGLGERAAGLETMAAEVREEFQRRLIVDETLTGFAYFHDDGRVDYLLHPRDRTTGLSYSLLPMIHAIINGLFTPDRPGNTWTSSVRTCSGPTGPGSSTGPWTTGAAPRRYFQRAESAAFFGREIGLMYTHAHLRYAEALARYGDAEGFFLALCQANPIGLRTVVPAATPAPGQLLLFQLRCGLCRPLPGERRIWPGEKGGDPPRRGLAGLFERGRHLDKADATELPGRRDAEVAAGA